MITLKKAFGLCLGAAVALTSCSPETPSNEKEHKLHEDPIRAVFTLQEGTLNGGNNFEASPKLADFKSNGSKTQVIEYQTSATESWHISSPEKKFTVKNTEDNPNVVYLLKIEYFNAQNEPINSQFYTQGQDKIHQHFFSMYQRLNEDPTSTAVRVTKKENLAYDYCYADELNNVYVGETNPLGFEGFIKFVKPGKAFELSVELLHASQSKYDEQGKTSPFYLPSRALRSTGQWDISVKLPVEVEGIPTEDEPGTELDPALFSPDKVEINIYDGHIHEPANFHQNAHAKENKYLSKNYKLVYRLEDGKWKADESNPKWVGVLSSSQVIGGCVYAFDIHYYKGDTEITNELYINDENKHYQHFFMVSDIKPGYGGKEEETDKNNEGFFSYTYRDTTPWNQTNHFNKAPYAEPERQLGLKGYFLFKKPYKKLNLNIKLMRARNSKLSGGKPSPFYAPTQAQLTNEAWMPTISVPVYVYIDNADKEVDADLEKDESEYDEDEKKAIRAMMDAFDIKDFKEAAAEFYWNLEGDRDTESASYWF